MIPIHSNQTLSKFLHQAEPESIYALRNTLPYFYHDSLYDVRKHLHTKNPRAYSERLVDGSFGTFLHNNGIFLISFGVLDVMVNKEFCFYNTVRLFSYDKTFDGWNTAATLDYPVKNLALLESHSFETYKIFSRQANLCIRRAASSAASFEDIMKKLLETNFKLREATTSDAYSFK